MMLQFVLYYYLPYQRHSTPLLAAVFENDVEHSIPANTAFSPTLTKHSRQHQQSSPVNSTVSSSINSTVPRTRTHTPTSAPETARGRGARALSGGVYFCWQSLYYFELWQTRKRRRPPKLAQSTKRLSSAICFIPRTGCTELLHTLGSQQIRSGESGSTTASLQPVPRKHPRSAPGTWYALSMGSPPRSRHCSSNGLGRTHGRAGWSTKSPSPGHFPVALTGGYRRCWRCSTSSHGLITPYTSAS